MGIFICNICEKECDGVNSLRSHSIQKHNISGEKIYIEYILKGIIPKCECGCDDIPPFISIGKGFSRFIRGHHNRVIGKNNFHKDPKTHQKAIETQKKNWKEGKYVGWWEDKSENTLNKIEGIQVKETSISPFDLQKADELFLTNVISGIQPITKYRKKVFTMDLLFYFFSSLALI
jgi:hypothetical protein